MAVGPTFFFEPRTSPFSLTERPAVHTTEMEGGGKEGIGTSSKQGGYGLTFKFHITQLPIARVLGFLGNALE